MYIEWIAACLPHGQLMTWMKTHCPDVSQRTIYNWRTLSRSICEWIGLKFATIANLGMSGDRLLELPPSKLPKEARGYREKIDGLLDSNHSAKQLFLSLGIKQGELTEDGYLKVKRGRTTGAGGNPGCPSGPIEAVIEYHRKYAVRHMGIVDRELNKMGLKLLHAPDAVLAAWLSTLERTTTCVSVWLNTPTAKRDPKEIQTLWNKS
jgi:hypothetical protein